MIKKTILAFFSVVSFSLPSFAQAFNLNSLRADGLPASVAPSSTAAPAAVVPAVKEWTVMYYSSAKDRKLRTSLLGQLLDMKNAGSNDKVNVLVEAPFAIEDGSGAVSTVTARLVIGAAWDVEKIKAVGGAALSQNGYVSPSFLDAFGGDVTGRENNVDSGDWRRAAAFVTWAKANYPAKHYAFVIFGHGNGFFDFQKTSRSTLEDGDTGNYVSVPEMRLMMAGAGKVDIFIMESCLMQTAEVAWEVKDYADVVLGSSEFLWSSGYPIGQMVWGLGQGADVSPEELGGWLAEGYVAGIKKGGKTGQSSVILTSKLNGFGEKLDAWADAVMAVKDRTLLFPALRQVMRFDIYGWDETPSSQFAKNVSFSGDLYDFVRLSGELLPADIPEAAAVRAAGKELMDYISGELVSKHVYTGISDTGFDFARAGGIAAYMPSLKSIDPQTLTHPARGSSDSAYWGLPFAKETRWGVFVHWLYGDKRAAY